MFSYQQKSSRRNHLRRQMLGACLALAGFVSQYPIPAIHQCPVMNPGSVEHTHHDHSSPADHSEPAARDAVDGPHSGHVTAPDLAHLPPCHRRLAEKTAQAESTREGPHGHESCPVCQGHAQLIPGLVATTTPVVSTLFEFHSSIPQFAEITIERVSFALPQSRAPPVGA